MFLSRGITVENVSARVKTLKTILNTYISRKFTGRIAYRYPIAGVFISIEMIDGSIIACRGVVQGALYEGSICCEVATEYLDRVDGSIEVVEVRAEAIASDITIFPSSKVEEETSLHRQLVVVELGIEQAEAKPAIEVEVTTTTPQSERRVGRVVASGCIDEVQLYSILKSAQLVLQSSSPLHQTDIERILGELQGRNPKYIYISGATSGQLLRILIDMDGGVEYYQIEAESGSVCGEEAHQYYLKEGLLNARIWIA